MTHYRHKRKEIRRNRTLKQPPVKRSGAHDPGQLVRQDLKEIELTLTPLPDHLSFAATAVQDVLARVERIGRQLGLPRHEPVTPRPRRNR